MTDFTPVSALLGGALIGLAASAMLLLNGRIAGISGIFGGLLAPVPGDVLWRVAFVGGLLTAGLLGVLFVDAPFGAPTGRSLGWVGLAGVLVGVGVRMGNGCTSGHGVCGLSRLSPRSFVATGTFMAAGAAAAILAGSLLGGG